MAVVPTALLLRPLLSLDHQPSVSTASLVGSSSSHGSFSLFIHYRRPQSFRPAISRITPVDEEEQASSTKRSNSPPWDAAPIAPENSPPWLKESSNAVSTPKPKNYRASPWQQGSQSLPQDAPWQQGPLDVDSEADDGTSVRHADAEADKSAMLRIVEKLRHIQKAYDPADCDTDAAGDGPVELGRGGRRGSKPENAIFHLKKRAQAEQNGVERGERKGKSATEEPNRRAADEGKISIMQDTEGEGLSSKFPWEKDEKAQQEEQLAQALKRGPRVPTLAELTLPREELKRLRILGLQLDERLRIGKLGVTKNIAISIQEKFRSSELVKVRCEGPAAASIKKTHLELEEKTGGLVVLRTGKIIVVYRGSGYKPEQRSMREGFERRVDGLISRENRVNVQAEVPLPNMITEGLGNKTFSLQQDAKDHTDSEVGSVSPDLHHKSNPEAEAEAESILEGLGPRFENWTGLLPVPIDADLLPPVIPNYKPPFRLMPYGVKPRISDAELTNLRRLARPLAPHFVLGRNRGHHGLAAAMVKLWEKSEIAKVAVKKRVQNSNNLIMSDELRRLTGGVLLSRDKFFITFYRGKDFVPEKVAAALVTREASVRDLQELEEKAREERSIPVKWTPIIKPSMAVISEEAPPAKPSWVHSMDIKEQNRLKKEVVKLQRLTLARQLEKKLGIAYNKKKKAEEEVKKLDVFLNPIDRPIDVETITEEERYMFRKLGLKMKAYLLLGRRGVFDGVVENMHLHWKHRELVKIVVKEVNVMEVQDIARTLEYESGGILVAVELAKKGHAIIMYRGKNYQRPFELRPRNLLTKRKALKKSLEVQRHESISRNIKDLQDQILSIQAELRKLSDGDGADGLGLSEGFGNHHQDLSSSGAEGDGLPSKEKGDSKLEDGKEIELRSTLYETEMDRNFLQERIKQLERLVRSGPLYRADPLSNPERLQLRKEALSSGKAPQFFVGKNNGLEGVARGIRIFFLHHDLVKIVVKGRGPEMLIEDIIHDLEELTGGVLVSREANKIIMYRGWPKGGNIPFTESLGNITPELLSALEAEEDWEDDTERGYMISGEAEESDESEMEDVDEWVSASMLTSDGGNETESDQLAVWEDIDEGSDEDSTWEDDDEGEGGGIVRASNSSQDIHHNSNVIDDIEEGEDNEKDTHQDASCELQAQFDDSAEDEDEDDDEGEFGDDVDEQVRGEDFSSRVLELELNGRADDEEDSDTLSSSFESEDEAFEDRNYQKLTHEAGESW